MRLPALPSALSALLLACAAPASAQIAVMGNTLQERSVSPGESYTGTILVMNPTREVQTAKLYQTDYSYSADGTSRFDAPGTLARSNASWVSLGSSQVTVAPGETVPVRFTVQVPESGALKGTYWSVVMVEGIPGPLASPRPGAAAVGLMSVIRYGVQVVSQIQDSGKRGAEFDRVRVVPGKAGEPTLEFEVRNPGERAYHLDVKVKIFDEQGAVAASFSKEHNLLYPGSSLLEQFALPRLAPQTYQLQVLGDTGEGEVFGGQFTMRM
jgi:hypothetical protein